ncbi:MAG: type III-A CRISPR-associated RAMP protein Csm4 [Nitrospirae bacterium]|nr:MAG: type III-A CRISPR-associated RAMP protein Csm4 [Nitrospirota bacterium]
MSCYLFRLQFTSPVHFGAAGLSMEESEVRLRADAWTSAVINALAMMDEADRAITALAQHPPAFLFSSLFPYGPNGQDQLIRYAVPRPVTSPPAEPDILRETGKDLKKLTWLTPEQAAQWLAEEPLSRTQLNNLIDHAPLKGQQWWRRELRPRVALDRTSQNSQIWLCGTITFQPGAGLYGLVQVREMSWLSTLNAALQLLGDMGIGGERTYGMGQFQFQGFEEPGTEWDRLLHGEMPRRLLLSVYHPALEERERLANDWEAWEWFESRGYITSGRQTTTLKRHRVRFFLEGSVARGCPTGTLTDVTPDVAAAFGIPHRCYRSGLAFLAPMGMGL